MKKVIGLTFFVLLGCVVSGHAETIVNVHKDGYIDDFTTSTVIPPDGVPDRLSDTNALLASRGVFTNFNVDSRVIMTFDISSYAGRQLTSAFLSGYGTRVDNAGSLNPIAGKFSLYSGDGEVGLADFNAPATFLGEASFQANPGGFNLSPFQIDIKSPLQQLLTSSHHFAEFRVESQFPTVFINAGEVDPASSFAVDTRWPGPQLALNFKETTAVPEPGSLFLLGSALVGGALARRKKKYA